MNQSIDRCSVRSFSFLLKAVAVCDHRVLLVDLRLGLRHVQSLYVNAAHGLDGSDGGSDGGGVSGGGVDGFGGDGFGVSVCVCVFFGGG